VQTGVGTEWGVLQIARRQHVRGRPGMDATFATWRTTGTFVDRRTPGIKRPDYVQGAQDTIRLLTCLMESRCL
jgi:hypothetical protein